MTLVLPLHCDCTKCW